MTQSLLKNLFCNESYVAVFAGTILTALGLLMAIRNGLEPGHPFRWWALFILLPGLMFFGGAWLAARGQAPYRVGLILFGLGLIVLTVASIFLLNLRWERWWPLMLIAPALPLFLIGLPDPALAQKPAAAAWLSLLSWVGATVILLGLTFLAGNFRLIDLSAWTQRFGWWGVFILLCAIGAAVNGAQLWMQTNGLSLPVLGLGLVAVTLLIAAVFECFHFGHRAELPWQLLASGILLVLYFVFSGRAHPSP
ncbi:MAG: hypothetical protein ACOYYS_07730 [Chloroflexota bacterium]